MSPLVRGAHARSAIGGVAVLVVGLFFGIAGARAQDGGDGKNVIDELGALVDTLANSARLNVLNEDFPGIKRASGAFEIKTVAIDGFDKFAVTQKREVWCWAASSEMVLRHGRAKADQTEIAERILDAERISSDSAGTDRLIGLALCPRWFQRYHTGQKALEDARARVVELGGSVRGAGRKNNRNRAAGRDREKEPEPTFGDLDSDDVVAALKSGEPVIIGFAKPGTSRGHVVVAFGVNFVRRHRDAITIGKAFDFAIESFQVIDPMDGTEKTLYAENVSDRVGLFLTKPHAQAVLEFEMAKTDAKARKVSARADTLQREKDAKEARERADRDDEEADAEEKRRKKKERRKERERKRREEERRKRKENGRV